MADHYLTKSRAFRMDAARQLRACGITLLAEPRRARNKIWVHIPGWADFVSLVADRVVVVSRNGATLAVTVQVEKTTGFNTSALAGKNLPATIGAIIETRAKLRDVAARAAGPGRPRIHPRERRLRRTFGSVVFVADCSPVSNTIARVIRACPKSAARVQVSSVDALSFIDRAAVLRTVVDVADKLLP